MTNRWTDDFLDQMRHEGDPPADAVIDALFEQDNLDVINNLMRTLVENDDMPAKELPEVVRDYLESTKHLPDWVDPVLLKKGGQLFNRYGPEMILLLFGASLPVLYAAHPGNQVLVATTRMTNNIHRRIIETGQFVFDVTADNAWEAHGRGIRTTQKIRLMHAAVRHFLCHDPKWKEQWQDDWFVPICQEDLAGTMLSFSVTTIQGLIISNITLNDEEKESYLHLWKVIGHLLGIKAELMPTDYDDAEALLNKWIARNHKDTKAGRELMGAMVTFWYDRVPGRMFDGITSGWARLWIGNDMADMLGIPPFDWTLNLLKLQTYIWKYEDKFEDWFIPYQLYTRFRTRKLMKAMLAIERKGK
ncbi:MAG: oxygenase MpaB family protein, partial [Anaerolineae bacterium]|nr:oxygenase MpaB family protein [Anaerolineae bacterium]